MAEVLVRYSGETDWDYWKPCFPDLVTMCEDIDRETRRLHDGDLVFTVKVRGPAKSYGVHIVGATFGNYGENANG